MKPYTPQEWKDGFTPDSWSEYQSFKFWSRVVGVLALAVFAIPFLTHADTRHHRRSVPTSSAIVTTNSTPISSKLVSSGYCFDFGHDVISNVAQVTAELTQLSKYSNCIRLAYNGSNNPLSEADALLAKSMGLRVIIGGDWGEFSQDQFTQYENEVIQEAKWAQANGIAQLSLGNEQEYRLSGLSIGDWISDLKRMASAARSVYGGTISYETSGDFTSDWVASGSLSSIDSLGLNLYCGYECNSGYLKSAINAFGVQHVYISESGCDIPNIPSCSTDAGLAKEVESDAVLLHKNFPSTPIYMFTWSANGQDGVPSSWGISSDPLTLSEL